MMQGGNQSSFYIYLTLRNVKAILEKSFWEKKKTLVESSKTTLNLSIKSFAKVIIFEIGTHYENADII